MSCVKNTGPGTHGRNLLSVPLHPATFPDVGVQKSSGVQPPLSPAPFSAGSAHRKTLPDRAWYQVKVPVRRHTSMEIKHINRRSELWKAELH